MLTSRAPIDWRGRLVRTTVDVRSAQVSLGLMRALDGLGQDVCTGAVPQSAGQNGRVGDTESHFTLTKDD